ncbi:UDP-3-O-(3-hydroxymyristoyl)glucosamine N-acyltransferase [Pusillimonas noertemannii]|uniref:UDP-3-O-acylglucosamine N-acyltransferase n=1 Tax=Pusillimonas noertemannii TaxID=305977 RepID=A0A2U1CJL8_9BURK|nr:UDP-3-O-(3-hydroxymyristoyl)glucosamine N-acyltransferase [Pusillimonas noertemannii]NYT69866.1 UDP-3-O-(3-hydroxymyristoyl)glucosamine N-acyltransferase [Pusillimonas noertemannii]PVY61210.1 UDP-3-O-[3-hydroxymyristoyl] glucosamine N-acyltransferase [Pusillimonas noertemannii]TFL09165.1 UDP-3-O-(3-hydroxymyristoyl)glucosamine N-acyltransferase [Pusillimonas noertemannii]
MPVLLAPEQAPTLPGLLQAANPTGLDSSIVESDEPMPRIRGLGSLLSAGPSEISFLANPRLQGQLAQCRAAAVILTPETWQSLKADRPPFRVVLCSQPYLMYALLAQWFDRHRIQNLAKGIHPSAVIAASAQVAPDASIGPNCVIEDGARVGPGTRLGPGCIIGAGSSVGADGLLHAGVTLYHGVHLGDRVIVHSGAVLGADGFGFAPYPGSEPGAWAKIAQLGGVQVGNDVEIGANTTIDRGALEDTVIGNGVKLDNQIMVAHNVRIGDHTAMAACVGIAGSTVIGARCTIGGAAMLSGHIVLGDDVHVSGGTAITANVEKPGRYTGVYPFDEHVGWQRNAAVLGQLSQLRKRLRALEKHDK